MNLSVITVSWNGQKFIADQIRSVESGCTNISYEQIVIDNNSADRTVEIVEKCFPKVKLIKNNRNTGFSFANNQGAKISTGEFLLFLNQDMRVQAGSLEKMVDYMKTHPKVGIASCKLINESGEVNKEALPRRFPGLIDQVFIILKIHHLFPNILNKYLYNGFDANKKQEVDSVRGSFLMMRMEIYEKLGWAFDPRYFFWFEDVDICREVKKMGYKIVYNPIVSCMDYVGQSVKKRTTLWKQKQFTKSMLQYFCKWEPWWKCALIAFLRPIGIVIAFFASRFKR